MIFDTFYSFTGADKMARVLSNFPSLISKARKIYPYQERGIIFYYTKEKIRTPPPPLRKRGMKGRAPP
jgi:hypothetical protein